MALRVTSRRLRQHREESSDKCERGENFQKQREVWRKQSREIPVCRGTTGRRQKLKRRNGRQKKKGTEKDKGSERKGEERQSLQMKHLTTKESSNKY